MSNKESDQLYTIGVVTYHARFDEFLKPLVKKISSIFSDIEIILIINGHPDRTKQIKYLKKITDFLKEFKNIKYLTYDQHQSLSKCWNQIVIMSNTDNVLIMNDDTQVSELFRVELESKTSGLNFSTINNSWSHFLISKDIIRSTGWFDENFLGVGHEDADYAYRMVMSGYQIKNTDCQGLKNYVADQKDTGWKDISKKNSTNKYSQLNLEVYNNKWSVPENNQEDQNIKFEYTYNWNGCDLSFTPKKHDYNLDFYDMSVLDENSDSSRISNYKPNAILLIPNRIKYSIIGIAKKIKRVLFFPRSR
jgi:hypothetical protein